MHNNVQQAERHQGPENLAGKKADVKLGQRSLHQDLTRSLFR
jgi:hypothetical protein